jgi:hypothetical protein
MEALAQPIDFIDANSEPGRPEFVDFTTYKQVIAAGL